MTLTKAAAAVASAGFLLFIVDGVRERIDPRAAAAAGGLVAAAVAQAGACKPARASDLAGNWIVRSVGCAGDCKQTHLGAGDELTFAQDVSGAENFSLSIKAATGARASSTDGYTMQSDGVGNVTGPIVLPHNVLDGTPLQLHWLIVKVRRYDADGLGQCKLRARASVCEREPAAGASACSDHQHGGELHLEPF